MIGRKIHNRYEITEHLGDGSTATVYKALDTRLSREVALKVLLPHVRDTTRKRFFQEAQAAAQLNHPNIMAIYDIGEDDEQPYLVVEYVDGVPLSYYLRSTPEVIVDLGQQIALALQYAHDRQIIHRDIKPANIKVTSEGRVKIMDLGLALPREAKRVTAHGMVIGTPAYLSPEQAQGLPLDHRTDIYSLGIVLYELATGQLPFNADDISALLLQQVKQPPPPPRLIVPELPIVLESAILRALEKNPVRRFQSCKALATALSVVIAPAKDDDDKVKLEPPSAALDSLTLQSDRTPPPVRAARPALRIILADDHTILRKTLASFLETRDDFVVVAEAADGEAALQQTLSILPDVLVLDLNMPLKTGLEVVPVVRAKAPSVKVLILTGRDEDAYIVRALRAGAHGYMLKSADESEFVDGILKVTQGQLVLGRGVAERIVSGLLTDGTRDKLDDNERKVLLCVAAGYETEAIARYMRLSTPVAIETLARAMDKLGAKDRHAAALLALRAGHILLEEMQSLPPAEAI
ncbi:MAG: protein kinase [Chloroflexi bacterium]|nr:protein kinase [Chloroflexota bacterium]